MQLQQNEKYAVVVDISPSEQINDDENEVRIMVLVFGLHKHNTFEKVGSWILLKIRL